MRLPKPQIVLGLITVATTLFAQSEWTTFRGNAFRSGCLDDVPLPRSFSVRWTYRPAGQKAGSARIDSSPAPVGDAVYVGLSEQSVFSRAGRLVCLDARTGKLRWEAKMQYPIFSAPSVAGGRVFVGEGYHQDAGCKLYSYDAKSGKQLWSFATKSHVESGPHVERDRVYFGAGDDGVYCLNAADGSVAWHFPDEHIDISPLVTSGFVFTGTGYGKFAAICLSAKNGKERWRTPVDLPVWGAPVRVGNRVFFGLGNGNFLKSAEKPRGAVLCVTATTGKAVWRRDLPDAVLTAMATRQGKLFVGSRDGIIYALNATDGNILWKHSTAAPVVASLVVGPKSVAAINTASRFVLCAQTTGERLARADLAKLAGDQATAFASPAAARGQIVLASGGTLVALGASANPAVSTAPAAPPPGRSDSQLVVDPQTRTVTIPAVAASQGRYREQLKGAIEYVLVSKGGKDYEALFWTAVPPEKISAAFRELAVEVGRPADEENPPRGASFRILADYEQGGKRVRRAVGELIVRKKGGSHLTPQPWTFTGSRLTPNPQAENAEEEILQCALTKNVVGLHYTDPSPLFQNSRAEARTENIYKADTGRLPAAGTPVRLLFQQVIPQLAAGVKRIRVVLGGRVRSVGFPAFARREARKLGLKGLVRKAPDGRIEVVVEGRNDDLQKFIAKLRRGPRAARVTNVKVTEVSAQGDFTDFEVRN